MSRRKAYCTRLILLRVINLFLLPLTLGGCLCQQSLDSYWHETTLNDLKFIQDTLIVHSAPGSNSKDHHFQDWLKEGFLQASKNASKVRDKSGYMSILQFYVNGFKIDHLSINFLAGEKEKQEPERVLPFEETPPMGIKFINKGVWITLPTFSPNKEQRKIFTDILKNLKKFRKLAFILFDLRSNGGGSSDWQRPLLRNLYGDHLIKSLGARHSYNQKWAKRLRVSLENYESLQDTLTPMGAKCFKDDLTHCRDYHLETWDIFSETTNLFSHLDRVRSFPKVFLLTDGRCESTCWLFVREMLQMPNVIQIGAATQAQSLYSEARCLILPSKLSKLSFPMQQRLIPIEHINEPFLPAYMYTNDWSDEEKLKKWAVKIINRTLPNE